MNPDKLTCPGMIHNTDKDYIGKWNHLNTIHKKQVLCIGYSEAEIDELVVKHGPARITSLTNWEAHGDADFSKYELVMGDITTRTGFGDNQFDAVLTLSVMEHLLDLQGAMSELSRILKPGGGCYIFFGPAWSCAWGHHLYARPGDPLLDFSVWQMPAHLHLLCSRDQIRQFYLEKGYSEADVQTVFHWFYETPLINRIMYEDYLRYFSLYFTLAASEIMYADIDPAILAALRQKYINYTDFCTYGGKFLLKNQKQGVPNGLFRSR